MSKPNHGIVRRDNPNDKTGAPEKTLVASQAIDTGLVLKAINAVIDLRREREYLRAECERKDRAIAQFNNIIAEKDRAFGVLLRERDAWHKTAEEMDFRRHRACIRGDFYQGCALFWAAIFFASIAITGVVVAVARYGWR